MEGMACSENIVSEKYMGCVMSGVTESYRNREFVPPNNII